MEAAEENVHSMFEGYALPVSSDFPATGGQIYHLLSRYQKI
jgi:hypothetical protein